MTTLTTVGERLAKAQEGGDPEEIRAALLDAKAAGADPEQIDQALAEVDRSVAASASGDAAPSVGSGGYPGGDEAAELRSRQSLGASQRLRSIPMAAPPGLAEMLTGSGKLSRDQLTHLFGQNSLEAVYISVPADEKAEVEAEELLKWLYGGTGGRNSPLPTHNLMKDLEVALEVPVGATVHPVHTHSDVQLMGELMEQSRCVQ
ncbi:unnamed protein product [Polarella glacialis]|uniref:Uncharacterized protein n=1 Tax=Polarella glacialis TaxID=89957 RepID=A0A813D7A4_POLGL|nr:unnamed protein product [Polarella glacialis]